MKLERAMASQNADEKVKGIGKPLPFLVVMPSSLLMQWVFELNGFTNAFKIYVYHGDPRMKGNAAKGAKRINAKLTKDHPLFSGQREDNANAIILTSYQTFAGRHGPAALRAWRRSNAGPGRSVDKSLWTVPDRGWPNDLRGCFRAVFLDEAHIAKNEESHMNIAVRWIDCDFNVLTTATPLHSSLYDFTGFYVLSNPEEMPASYSMAARNSSSKLRATCLS